MDEELEQRLEKKDFDFNHSIHLDHYFTDSIPLGGEFIIDELNPKEVEQEKDNEDDYKEMIEYRIVIPYPLCFN